MLVITYDEHGGFFDHVPPPTTDDERPDFRQLGFRVPALVIGPTGVALSQNHGPDHGGQTLYVADSLNNRIVAIEDAMSRNTSDGTGKTVAKGGALNDPLVEEPEDGRLSDVGAVHHDYPIRSRLPDRADQRASDFEIAGLVGHEGRLVQEVEA